MPSWCSELLRALAGRGPPPSSAAAAHIETLAPRRCRPDHGLAGGAAPRRQGGGALAGRARRERAPAAGAARAGADGRLSARSARGSSRRRCSTTRSRCASPTRCSPGPRPAAVGRGAIRCVISRPPGCSWTPGALADACAEHLLVVRPAADPWVVSVLRRAAASAGVPGAPRRRRSGISSERWPSRPRRRNGRRCCWNSVPRSCASARHRRGGDDAAARAGAVTAG